MIRKAISKWLKTAITILLMLLGIVSYSQEKEFTEDECQKVIDDIWNNNGFNRSIKLVSDFCFKNPNNAVSLQNLYCNREDIKKEELSGALKKVDKKIGQINTTKPCNSI